MSALNHFHGIIQIINEPDSVGADLRVCPDDTRQTSKTGQSHRIAHTGTEKSGEHALGKHALGKHALGEHALGEHALGEHALGEHIGSPLHAMIQWFKTMTTNEYIRGVKNNDWPRFNKKIMAT